MRRATPSVGPAMTSAYVASWRAGYEGMLSVGAVDRARYPAVWQGVVDGQARARRFYERQGWRLDDDVPPATNGLVTLLHYRYDL